MERACLLFAALLTPAVPAQAGSPLLAPGYAHTALIRSDGALWVWGRNLYGEVGDGTTTERPAPVKIVGRWISVATGESKTVAIRADGMPWARGYNYSGQLGDGTEVNRPAPVAITSNSNWKSAVAGSYHSAALKTDGTP